MPYAETAEKIGKHVIGVTLTFKQVRRELPPDVDDSIVKEIVKTGDARKVQEVKKALNELSGLISEADRYSFSRFLRYGGIRLFVDNPQASMEMARMLGGFLPFAFDTLKYTEMSKFFSSQPQTTIIAFADISKLRGAKEIFSLLARESETEIREMFCRDPRQFVALMNEISKNAGTDAPHAFITLSNKDISAMFARQPQTVTVAFADVSRLNNRLDAFITLNQPQITEEFVKDPFALTAKFARLEKQSGETTSRAAFSALVHSADARDSFVKNPDATIASFAELARRLEKADPSFVKKWNASSLEECFESKEINRLFIENPKRLSDVFVKIAGCKNNHEFFWAISSWSMADTFAKNPEAVADVLLKAVAKAPEIARWPRSAFVVLVNKDIAAWFFREPKSATEAIIKVYEVTSERWSSQPFLALCNDRLAAMFVKDPESVIAKFRYLANISGAKQSVVFSLLSNDTIAGLFVKNPAKTTDSLLSVVSLPNDMLEWNCVYTMIENRRIAEFLVNNPASFCNALSELKKAMGGFIGLDGLGEALRNDRIAAMFVANHKAMLTPFSTVLESNPFKREIFGALKNDKLAEAFAKDPMRFVTALKTLADRDRNSFDLLLKKENAHAAFAKDPGNFVRVALLAPVLLKNDRLLELYLKGPERLESAVWRLLKNPKLRSSTGLVSPLSNALESNEIAELFLKDPERAVTLVDRIVKNTGRQYILAFSALGNDKIAALFVRNPELVIKLFGEISAYGAGGLDMLEHKRIGEAFAENPQTVTDAIKLVMAHPFGTSARVAFFSDDIAGAFAKDPHAVARLLVEFGKSSGKAYEKAFHMLPDKSISPLFLRNQKSLFEACALIANSCTPEVAGFAFQVLPASHQIAAAFARDPPAVAGRLVQVAKNSGNGQREAFFALMEPEIAGFFVRNPNRLLDAYAGLSRNPKWKNKTIIFHLVADKRISPVFVASPKLVVDAFNGLADYAGAGAERLGLYIGRGASETGLFVKYAKKELSTREYIPKMISTGDPTDKESEYGPSSIAAIEIGRPLDDLHARPVERAKYLNSLTTAEVVGLLCSNPEYFYTSSNHLLFDRLKNDLKGKELAPLIADYKLDEAQIVNFIFRAINYDRLEDFTAKGENIRGIVSFAMKGISEDEFDGRYYYLLANGLRNLDRHAPWLSKAISARLLELELTGTKSEPGSDTEKITHALTFMRCMLGGESGMDSELLQRTSDKSVFNPDDYRGPDGKKQVIQIFDRNDTQRDHWPFTQAWFGKTYGKPKIGKNGEVIYESKDARVTLYMGENSAENREFLGSWLEKNPNAIVTFRGHSYSLHRNMPPEVFANRPGHILLIPGSCGSSGSVPVYTEKNPNTDLRMVTNTSTGKGQVTNAIVDLAIAQKSPIEFSTLLSNGAKKIEQNGGDTKTLKVWNPGEALLYYVRLRTSPKVYVKAESRQE